VVKQGGHGTDPHSSEEQQRHVDAVLLHHYDAVSRLHTSRPQGLGQGRGLTPAFRKAQFAAGFAQPDGLGPALGGLLE
jgi:hypothetical protein